MPLSTSEKSTVIRLKSLLTEGIWYKDLPKRFDEAERDTDARIAELQARKKQIAVVKRERPKYFKLLDDWGWGRGKAGKMTDDQFNKMMRKYEEKLADVGVISDFDRIES